VFVSRLLSNIVALDVIVERQPGAAPVEHDARSLGAMDE
jgi:hypothetical protein